MSQQDNFSEIEASRAQKITDLRQQGLEPYPTRAERSHTNAEAIAAFEAVENAEQADPIEATLVGRIRSLRDMGKIIFAHIEDGYASIQLFLRANELGEERLSFFRDHYDLGDFVQASGSLFRTRTGEISLQVTDFTMLAKAISPLPAAKDEEVDGEIVRHAALTDPETRYRQRYADLAVNPEVREVFRMRAGIVRALRAFLDQHDFLEVETPVLQKIGRAHV